MTEELNESTTPADDGELSLSDFLGETAEEEVVDTTQVVVLRFGSEEKYVPTTESITIRSAIERTGLAIAGAISCYINGAMVSPDTAVAPGTVVSVVASVKGG